MTAPTWPNPLIAGFYPDPSVVKVGADYYLATSTFEYLPGIPVFHSTDLVTWTQLGHVVQRPGQLASAHVPTLGGAWALIAGVHGIDTDLAWDEDGLAYITYSGLDVTSGEDPGEHKGILQFTVDLATGTPLSSPVSVWSGTGLKFPEAPHLYQHGEYWYLLIAEGGTERGHGISVARGARPCGPFTEGAAAGGPANPILSARSTDRPIQNTGHADLVETPDGGWALVMLGMRPTGMTQAFSALGRETFITSARWENGWLAADPVLLNPRAGETVATLADGRLVLTGGGRTLDAEQPALVGVRQRNPWSSTSVRIGGVTGSGDGLGGLGVRYDEDHHYEIEVGTGVVTARACVAGIRQEWTVPLAPEHVVDGAVTLGLDTVPPVALSMLSGLTSDLVVLSVGAGADRVELARVDGRYLSQETAASFTGRVLCLFAVTGEVSFAGFRYTGTE